MAFVPDELEAYHEYHAALNDFTWLLKVWFTPKDDLKRRRFRLDRMLQSYIRMQVEDNKVLARCLGSPKLLRDETAAAESLQKIWYNELAFCTPPLVDPLILDSKGVQVNIEASTERLVFPSWKIAQAYYTVYHAIRTLVDLRGVPYHKSQHTAPGRAFKGAMLAPASTCLISFPFTVAADRAGETPWSLASAVGDTAHLRFRYADHPRYPRVGRNCYSIDGAGNRLSRDESGQSFERTANELVRALGVRAALRKATDLYMLPDLLSDLRNWGNYVDIDNMVALKGSGFRAYLDQDLHTIVFFYAAFAELAAVALLGPERFLELAHKFHEEFVERDETLWRMAARLPMDTRIAIYQHVGRLDGLHWAPEAAPPTASPLDLI